MRQFSKLYSYILKIHQALPVKIRNHLTLWNFVTTRIYSRLSQFFLWGIEEQGAWEIYSGNKSMKNSESGQEFFVFQSIHVFHFKLFPILRVQCPVLILIILGNLTSWILYYMTQTSYSIQRKLGNRFLFLIGVELLYDAVFVSAVQQNESTRCIRISPSSWTSLPPCHSTPLGHHREQSWPPYSIQQVSINCIFYTW